MKKLAIVTTHPIQYNAPFFKLLTERGRVQLKIFYTWPQAVEGFNDPDFGKQISWDIPLLDGYEWEAVENVSKKPSSKYWKGIDCPDLNKRIDAFHPDAILVYGWNLKSHFKAMRYFKGKIPVWFFGDSTLLDEQPGVRKILRRLWLRWVYTHIDKAFFVGTNNKNYFLAHGLKEDQLVIFPHAVDNQRFFDTPERDYESKARQWRHDLGFRNDDIVLLFAGKLEAKKNPLIILEAVCQINQRDQPHSSSANKQITKSADQQINLLFAGNGPLESELRTRTIGLDFIKFLPFQNQAIMPVVYRLGDLFCLTSQGPGETWGLAVNEALACGRPVLASNKVGCSTDLVKSGINGEVFHWNDLNDCLEKIRTLKGYCKKLKRESINETIFPWSYEKKCETIEFNLNTT